MGGDFSCFLSKLIIGLTKGFIRGKALSVEGHTHDASDINSGILSILRGGTGVSNLDALKAALNVAELPSGIILLWSGASTTIPSGWVLCNGSNGTPNLIDRFIVGAGSTYAVGATGGSDTVTLTTAQMPSHKHSFSGSSHSHTLSGTASGTLRGSDPTGGAGGKYITNNAYNYDTISISLNLSGTTNSVTTSGTIGNTGSGQAHENRPPYYALCYIMKL